jgi:hypothetical protein
MPYTPLISEAPVMRQIAARDAPLASTTLDGADALRARVRVLLTGTSVVSVRDYTPAPPE